MGGYLPGQVREPKSTTDAETQQQTLDQRPDKPIRFYCTVRKFLVRGPTQDLAYRNHCRPFDRHPTAFVHVSSTDNYHRRKFGVQQHNESPQVQYRIRRQKGPLVYNGVS